MTTIIAIETATEACSAALLIETENKQSLYKRFQLAPREHTKLILPMLDEVLAEANIQLTDVDAIAFGRGPGAFTGLRIAAGITQGLALSVAKPTIPVSSLYAMALVAKKMTQKEAPLAEINQAIVVSIDARMGEVYWAAYKIVGENVEPFGDEQISQPMDMYKKTETLSHDHSVTVIGSGWDEYIEGYSHPINSKRLNHIPQKFPEAAEIAELALISFNKDECQAIEDAQPVYLRNNVAEKSRKI